MHRVKTSDSANGLRRITIINRYRRFTMNTSSTTFSINSSTASKRHPRKQINVHKHLIAAAVACALGSGWAVAQAATSPETHAATTHATAPTATERAEMQTKRDAAMKGDTDALEQKLAAAQSRSDYAQIIESNGYRISAINSDKPDYLEYEIVKGDHSYEVQLDFKKGSAKAEKIDLTNNMWRADSTKAMLKDANYRSATPLVADPDSRYSDRRYQKSWDSEKDKLEKALPANMKVADYKPKLEKMGYKITSVNDREKDYVEYEIVKGDNSYEVQIDVDPKTQVAKSVDVASNLWRTDATKRAEEANKPAS